MVKYCIGVDMLNFPVFCTHELKVEEIIRFQSKAVKKFKDDFNDKPFNMKNK